MGFGIDNHGKMGFTVQDNHAENSSQSQNAQGGKPGQAATPASETSANQAAPTSTSAPPPAHADNASRPHEAGAAQHEDSIADKKAKGFVTGDEVVANLQATTTIQNQLLSESPPLPKDQDPALQGLRLSASDAQRLFQSMGDINAQLNLCEQDSSSDNHAQIQDALKKLQDEITKREAFNSRFEAQFDKIMGEIGADAGHSQFCRDNDLYNDKLTQQLEQQLGISPDQAVALVQGIRDGGAAGTALALSLATLMTDKALENSGLAISTGGSVGATGSAGAAVSVSTDDSDPTGLDTSAANTTGAGTTDTGATGSAGAAVINMTASEKATEDAAISADVQQLVLDAKNYDNSGSLFGGPDPGSAAAMQLLQDAMNVLATGMSGNAAGGQSDASNSGDAPRGAGGVGGHHHHHHHSGDATDASNSGDTGDTSNIGNTGDIDPTNDNTALSPGNFNATAGAMFISMVNNNQFDSPTAALNAVLQSNSDDIAALQKAAAALLLQAAAGQIVTRAIELAATNAGDYVDSVFNSALTTVTPVSTRA